MRVLMLFVLVSIYGCSSANSPVASNDVQNQTRPAVTDSDTEDESPIYEQYDFRWSKWNDSKEQVQTNEPGELEVRLKEGVGLSALESAWTTDVFVFSNGDKDTVDVEYEFAGDELYAGHYWFDETMTSARAQLLVDELNIRYGDPVSTTESKVTWMKNGDTEVYINLPSVDSGGCLHYYSPETEEKVEAAESYNNLPIRPVVPEI